MLDMCSKPIFCSKIAQKDKSCSTLPEQQKVAANDTSCSKVAEHNRQRPNGNQNFKKVIYIVQQNQTRSQQLLCIQEGLNEFAVHQGKEERKTRSALLFKLLCTRQFSFRCSFARINKWRKGTNVQQNNNSAHESRFFLNLTSAFLSLFLNVDTVLQNSSRHRRCSATTATTAKRSPVNRTCVCFFVCLLFKLPFDYSNSLNISNTGVFLWS